MALFPHPEAHPLPPPFFCESGFPATHHKDNDLLCTSSSAGMFVDTGLEIKARPHLSLLITHPLPNALAVISAALMPVTFSNFILASGPLMRYQNFIFLIVRLFSPDDCRRWCPTAVTFPPLLAGRPIFYLFFPPSLIGSPSPSGLIQHRYT